MKHDVIELSDNDLVQRPSQNAPKRYKVIPYKMLGSSRLSIAIITSLGFVMMMIFRLNLSVTIVSMVNHTALDIQKKSGNDNSSIRMSGCRPLQVTNNSLKSERFTDGEFVWNKKIQGLLMASGAWGFIIAHIPLGISARKFGPRVVFGWSTFLCSVANFMMPFAANLHIGALFVLRILAGACQAAMQPSAFSIMSNWAPPLERSRLIGLTHTGIKFGGFITLPLTGLLCKYGFEGGWPTVFYFSGILGIIWCLSWALFAYDMPTKHPRIHHDERNYIDSTLVGQLDAKTQLTPWKAILTSKPVWAITVCQCCSIVGTITFAFFIPSYIKDLQNLDIATNGALSSIPMIGEWLFLGLSSVIADKLIINKILTVTKCRKTFQLLGTLIPAVLLIGLANLGCESPHLSLVLLSLAVTFTGCMFGGGFMINNMDIAPTYSAIIFALSNTFGMVVACMIPILVGFLTTSGLLSGWHIVFYIVAGSYIISAIVYLIFGTGELQSWAVHRAQAKERHPLKLNSRT